MPALLWALARALVGLLAKYAGPILVQVIAFFGFQFGAQKFLTQPFVAFIQSAISGAPAIAVQALSSVNFDKAVTIILSAYVVRAGSRVFLHKKATS